MPKRIQRSRREGERRYDTYGELRLIAEADGYVMYRRPGRYPFVRSLKQWDALSAEPCHADVLLELANG